MKKTLVFVAGLLIFALNAANIDWLVKVDKTSTVKDAQKASVDGIMPKDSKKVTTKGSENLQIHRMAGRLYFGGTGFRGIACAKLTFDNDCTQMIGFGANNFCTLFINGEQIATTEPGGNFYRPIHATNYVKNVKFKKGDKVLICDNDGTRETTVLEAYIYDPEVPANDLEVMLKANMGKQCLNQWQQGWLVLDDEKKVGGSTTVIV